VIAILLASFGISAGYLEVSIGDWTDPHIFPGWWNNQGFKAMELESISNSPSVRAEVDKSFAGALAPNARLCVGYITKVGPLSGDSWVHIDKKFPFEFGSLFGHRRDDMQPPKLNGAPTRPRRADMGRNAELKRSLLPGFTSRFNPIR
jgi:hypothetical protein